MKDPKSPASRPRVVATCDRCHGNDDFAKANGLSTVASQTYDESYHGKAYRYGNERAPTCDSCHSAHGILPASSVEFANEPQERAAHLRAVPSRRRDQPADRALPRAAPAGIILAAVHHPRGLHAARVRLLRRVRRVHRLRHRRPPAAGEGRRRGAVRASTAAHPAACRRAL